MALIRRTIPSPLGPLTLVASPTGLREIRFEGEAVDEPDSQEGDSPILSRAAEQLAEYFAGNRREFDLPLEPQGTPFQVSVWKVIEGIEYGQTISYGEEARRLGDAKKSRAVGSANGRNPLPIVVPCHRIIGSDGSLTGYSGGMEKKVWLLDHERDVVAARLPVRKAADDPRLGELFAKGLNGPGGDPLNIFGVLGNHPDMLKRWLVFATHVLSKNSLSPRDRELLILRTGWNCGSRYEWGQHVVIARDCGISDAEIEAVKGGADSSSWSAHDRVLMRAADELHEHQTLSDHTWDALTSAYSTEQVLDVVATVGNYTMVAMFLNSTGVRLDEGVPDEPALRRRKK